MSKFIIEIRDGVSDYDGIRALLTVIAAGKISNNDTMYCYNTEHTNCVHVSAMDKREGSDTDKFIIHKNGKLCTK